MSSATATKQIKILIVEDDLYMQLILKEFLSSQYKTEIFVNGMDALASIQNGNIPDLIISDLNTAKITGLELLAQLQASDFFKSIPVIIVSGEDSSEKRILCLNSGADDYIVKPFNPAELEARVRVVLRRVGK
ncbi:response regulator transcription factor [Mucilaginibacter sp. E4BP6]|jgi:DNA-binding response OmpR family regulator|uniref:response regulator transcription factor n=1 Tax=Mucilaginibacter sp. E4BP6 TaxID=2723089 RepID=UPI0015C97178|nr:response regulator transcription factor [Mucilaginibacter sp. E4BP6]NYE66396.1 DNA-binding response OmpR family regulator [Mucilaginibacter sp. E4BP6]